MAEFPEPRGGARSILPARVSVRRAASLVLGLHSLLFSVSGAEAPPIYDVVVYGGTAGGVAAAVQTARMGRSVVLVEPTRRLGGLSSGGLGQTDIGNKQAIGGIAREFYRRMRRHYAQPAAWRWQEERDYRSSGQSRTGAREDTMWTFEPSAALEVFNDLVREHHFPVLFGERLDLDGGVVRSRDALPRIQSIRLESGTLLRGRMFIDATYEGDLMAEAGVSYTVGREANARYNETFNGVQTAQAVHHQLRGGIDPHVIPGRPESGLLPGIDPIGPGGEGAGDRRVQAYCFRMCLTDHPDNRLPIVKPSNYRERDYELLFRNFEAGFNEVPWNNAAMPNRKTDINNNHGFSTDFIGQNYDYADADYAGRAAIVQRHLDYQQGLLWTLANHSRVPDSVRREVSRWGPCRDEFTEGSGWQSQLYIREARRMAGAYVMTQHHCQNDVTVDDPVGLAAYNMDSHHVQRYVDSNGHVRNEGDVQISGLTPYPISYRSLIPKAEECGNLLVPVCLSASHIAFGSIRMEPVFMVLGQSAAAAAVLAIDAQTSVQSLRYPDLRQRLEADRQVLAWTKPANPGAKSINPQSLAGVVIDDDQARFDGDWVASRSTGTFVGAHYRHDDHAAQGMKRARFDLPVQRAGQYEIRLSYTPHANRASRVEITVAAAAGPQTLIIDQRQPPGPLAPFISLGRHRFEPGRPASVTLSNVGADGYVIADAVQMIGPE